MNINLPLRHLLLPIVIGTFFSATLIGQPPTSWCNGTPVTIDDYGNNDHRFWNAPLFWDPLISSHDLGESLMYLDFTATDHCSFPAKMRLHYLLSLDLNRDSIFETFINSDSLPPKNTVYFGNKPDHLFSGTPQPFDDRAVNPDQKWGFGIMIDSVGIFNIGEVIWKNELGQFTGTQMPYGTHRIKWTAIDSCGGSLVCEYDFTVKDSQQPIVECKNGLVANLMNVQGGMVQLWASDFVLNQEDNYTPPSQLEIAIRRSGTGIGFPYSPNGFPQTGLSFNACDLGIQSVELWVKDKDGNMGKCETYVIIQDNYGFDCFNLSLGGYVLTEEGGGVSNVIIEITGNNNGAPLITSGILTDTLGQYWLNNSLPLGSNAFVEPKMNLDPLNGVNTWDLLLISRHILGLEPLNSPYKLISADANKSGSVTTFDVVELRKLILGTYLALPNNNSWRFVDKNQVFSNPANPFADTLRESLFFNMLYNDLSELDFTGCKIGDVDLSAVPHFQSEPEDRNDEVSLLPIENQQVKRGETFTVHFETPAEMAGLQFTLNAKGLRAVKIIPGHDVTSDNFAVFSGGNESEPAPAVTAAFELGNVAFDVEFIALADGWISDMLQISSDITPSMAFEKNGARRDVSLHFTEKKEMASQPVLFQNVPNPWSVSTSIPFYLPEEGTAEINVFNQDGTVVFFNSNYYPKGCHQVLLNNNQIHNSGIYWFQLKTTGFTATKKLTFIQR